MDHAQELLARIRADKIRPVPRWRVRLARLGMAALFVATVFAGAVSVALAVQEVHAHAGRGWMFRRLLADWAPLIWGATSVLFVWAGARLFRELPRGWRVRPWHVVAGVGLASIAGGWMIERSNALMGVHHAMVRNVPIYREAWREKTLREWHAPDAGRISGRWEDAEGRTMALRDVEGTLWTIQWHGVGQAPAAPEGMRLTGAVCGDRVFCADDWRPVPGAGKKRRMR